MFMHRSNEAEKEPLRIGQPQLIHTTYNDQNIIPKWQGLTASAAPSEYFQRPLKRQPSRLSDHRGINNRSLSTDLSQALRPPQVVLSEMQALSSAPHLPNPLASHRIPASAKPEEPADTPKSTGSTKARKISATPRISLLQTQVAKLRQTFEAGESTVDKTSRRKSGAGLAPIKIVPPEKRVASAPQYEATVTANNDQAKSRKPSWAERAARMRKEAFDHRHRRETSPEEEPVIVLTQPSKTIRQVEATPAPESRPSTAGEEAPSPVSALGGRFEEGLDNNIEETDTKPNVNEVSPLDTPTSVTFEEAEKVYRKPVVQRNSLIKRLSMMGRKDRGNHEATDAPKELPHTLPRISDDEMNVSRFSWTTVNTITTAHPDSPPPSPPLDPVSEVDDKTQTDQELVVEVIAPPTPPMDSSELTVLEKPLPAIPTEEPAEEPLEIPAETQPMSRMDSFMAKELELKTRHHEIESSLQKLLKVEKASPLEVDWKTRKANKQKLDKSRAQLADVEREQHELGLAIARSRFREATNEGIEPTLWVRRATS